MVEDFVIASGLDGNQISRLLSFFDGTDKVSSADVEDLLAKLRQSAQALGMKR